MALVQDPIIPIVGDLIRNNPGTISLGQGVVNYGPPESATAALSEFLSDPGLHKYQQVEGIVPLREAFSAKLAEYNRIEINNKNRIVVTAGGNMAFMNAVLAIGDTGDEFILPIPYYFNHEMAITMAGCVPVLVPTTDAYQLDLEAIRAAITPRTRAIITVSPNNPTGAVYPEKALRELNELCREKGLYHINDEAYDAFVYDGAAHFSPASIPGSEDHTISLFSLSKVYGFASWRIGYMVIPEHLFHSVKKIQDTILICPPVISQYAAVGAMCAGKDYFTPKLESLARVRSLVISEFDQISSFCAAPVSYGAFYFFVRLATRMSPVTLVERLVRDFRVAAIPGNAFGMQDGCYLRVAYGALEPDTVREGIGRLTTGLRQIVGAER